jgi:hypothetical protein
MLSATSVLTDNTVIQIYNFNVLLRKKSIKGKHIHVIISNFRSQLGYCLTIYRDPDQIIAVFSYCAPVLFCFNSAMVNEHYPPLETAKLYNGK